MAARTQIAGSDLSGLEQPHCIILWPGRQAAAIVPGSQSSALGTQMRKLPAIATVLGLAVVLILTKPTPQEIVSAVTGQMNVVIFNKSKMPREFVAAAGAAAVLQSM